MNFTKPEIEEFKPGWRLNAAWGSIMIVNLACALDATSVSVALPAISAALHGTSIESLWIGTAFLLASTVFQPSLNAFSSRIGRKPVLIFALVLFTIGAVLCGMSKTSTVMLAGRVLQGSGVAGILTLSQALVTDLIPLRHRGNYFALMSIVWALGTIAGPLLGGVLAQKHSWRWIFYLNIPIVVVGFFGVVLFLQLEKGAQSTKEIIAETDWIGSTTFVASITAFLIAISWGGVMYPWSSWRTLVPLIFGFAGLVAFVFYEKEFASHPLIPIRIFRNMSTALTYLLDFLQSVILFSTVYYMPLYFMACHGYTPIFAGVAAFPQTLTVVPSAGIVGVIATKTGRYRWALWAGWVLTTLGNGLMYLLDVETKIVEWVFLLLIAGVGTGLLFPSMNLSIHGSVPVRDAPTAAGLFAFFRAFGQCLGVAIGGVIFQNRLTAELASHPQFAAYSTDAISLILQMNRLHTSSVETMLLKSAFANAIKTVWAAMCGIAGVSLIISLFIKEYDLNQVHETDQGFVGENKGPVNIDIYPEDGISVVNQTEKEGVKVVDDTPDISSESIVTKSI